MPIFNLTPGEKLGLIVTGVFVTVFAALGIATAIMFIMGVI